MATLGRFFDPPAGSFFLFGPRGTGKSTWIQQAFPDALRLDLLQPENQRAYAARPERLRDLVLGNPGKQLIVIDEVQRLPTLLDVVHELIEARSGLRFILTGSSARKLRRAGVNLLAGRAVHRSMHPFLAAELGSAFDLDQALKHGLVPLVWNAKDPRDAQRSYLDLYVREEVQQEGLVRDVGAFARFLEAVSLTHASPINLSAIAVECQVSRKTVEGYLGILHDLLLCFSVPVFRRRAQRKLTSHAKLFWFDVGVFAASRPAGPLDRAPEIGGAALEGLVAQHLRAWIDYGQRELQLHFWRTRAGNEVDFVLYGPGGFVAIEVKAGARVRGEDLRGLRAFGEDYPEAKRLLVHRGTDHLQIDGIQCVPVAEFLARVHPGQDLPFAR
ncbi:MAG TPA: AAA family ATPase [Planctomycetota bacterium]|nr:AAA family ATPase [Planctomycetota bacterium]